MPKSTVRSAIRIPATSSVIWGLALAISLAVSLTMAAARGHAEPAHFWISFDDSATDGPESPTVTGVLDTPRQVHIWAQPRTSFGGDYHPTLNPYLSLANVSLNVVSPDSDFGVDPASIVVYNPTYGSLRDRFELLHDSDTGLELTTNLAELPAGMSAGILGLQGFTFDPSLADGFGGVCDGSDGYCSPTPAEGDAWLFASFELTPTADSGSVELFLQVGINGMSHVGEGSASMEVIFGVETVGLAPAAYDPSTDKQETFIDDDPDATFTLVKPGDYDADGDVDLDDYAVWDTDYGTTLTAADGNSDGVVNAADYTIWRDNLEVGDAGGVAIPEPRSGMLLSITMFWLVTARPFLALGRRLESNTCGSGRSYVRRSWERRPSGWRSPRWCSRPV